MSEYFTLTVSGLCENLSELTSFSDKSAAEWDSGTRFVLLTSYQSKNDFHIQWMADSLEWSSGR